MERTSGGGKTKMNNLIFVRATWDSESEVWTAESPDLPGLVTEATSLNDLKEKLPDLIRDLLESDDTAEGFEVPVEVIASFSTRVRIGQAV
jgi:predicted RNase H-like HicB family nuclease